LHALADPVEPMLASSERDRLGPEPPPLRYSAFISYNHRDRRWAAWLHRALENYRLPNSVRGQPTRLGEIGAKLPPVFRDREELASSSDLAGSVVDALRQSSALIVICSPNGAKSRWVNEEIRTFRRLKGADQIHCVIVGGEPGAATKPGTDPSAESLPSALFEEGGTEPLAVDLRPGGDGKQVAKLKLIAGILGVGFDGLRRREAARRQRRLAALAAASLLGLLVTSALAIFAFISRAEAIEQRDLARQKTATAERTVQFVKSLFEVADPAEARGREISAREIVDLGAARLSTELQREPAVKAELMTTLAEVYLGLGLFREAHRIITSSFALDQPDPVANARRYLVLAASHAAQGRYQVAINAYSRALEVTGTADTPNFEQQSRILVARGEAYAAVEEFAKAERDIRRAMAMVAGRVGRRHPDMARNLEALGLTLFYSGRLSEARAPFEQALQLRRNLQGFSHPKVAENLNTLGSLAYMQGDLVSAERFYRDVIVHDTKVLGKDHPDLANTLNNLARVQIERRRFSQALPSLRRAVEINMAQRDDTHDDLAFIYANLGLAERGVGDRQRAEDAFLKALKPARLHKHRNLGPILADLGDLYCESARYPEALALLDQARPITAADYPEDPWRVAWVDNVRGRCLERAGVTRLGRALRESSFPILAARWPADTYYRVAAAR
jgi:tetratricopeptide (TPR) repeat protein